ncbi:hypothetical protein D9M68_477070 [compost metagenome]
MTVFTFNRWSVLTGGTLIIILLSIAFIRISATGQRYKATEAKIAFLGKSDVIWVAVADYIPFKGDFEVDESSLSRVSDVEFTGNADEFKSDDLQAQQAIQEFFRLNHCTQLLFKQRRAMILPYMKKVHLIGDLNFGKANQVLPMQLNYTLNADRTITVSGKQEIRLAEFDFIVPPQLRDKIADKMDLQLTFRLLPEEMFLD